MFNEYLYQLIVFVRPELERVSAGSTFQEISSTNLKATRLILPPLPEQKKIAAILTSVDEAIEKQEAQIAKLQDLKKALMQDLLTQGIGHTEFKDSPVGRIPTEWEVRKARDFLKLTSGKAKTKKELSEYGSECSIPVFGGNGINGYCNSPLLHRKTIVIGRVGEYCGCVHLTPTISWITDNALYVKELDENCVLGFIYYLLINAAIDRLRSQSGQPLISQEPIYDLQLPMPPGNEQEKIASVLTSIDDNIEAKQKKLAHTKSLKKSLMQDLLTGKVRVSVTPAQAGVQ